MPYRVARTFPPVIPPQLSNNDRVQCLTDRFDWTPGQVKVVLAGMEDLTYREIAERLGIAASTVKAHYNRACEKAGCHTRSGITALAVAALWQLAAPDMAQ